MSDAAVKMASEIREHVELSVDAIMSELDDLFDEIEKFHRDFDRPDAGVDTDTAQMLSETLYDTYKAALDVVGQLRKLRVLERELRVNIIVLK